MELGTGLSDPIVLLKHKISVANLFVWVFVVASGSHRSTTNAHTNATLGRDRGGHGCRGRRNHWLPGQAGLSRGDPARLCFREIGGENRVGRHLRRLGGGRIQRGSGSPDGRGLPRRRR